MLQTLITDKFQQAVSYADFVASGEPLGHRPPWDERYSQLALSPEQQKLCGTFKREMKVLCLTGTWCGDCALQGSALQRIAEGTKGLIDLRFILREDKHADLITKCQINAGFRVPVTWFMAEDFEFVSMFGDRSLSRYRSMARKALGPEVEGAMPAAPENPVRQVLSEMLDEVERVQWLLRLSGRLRQKHGD